MTIINDETVAITTFAELKSTIETNNTVNLIYLDANIEMTSSITIPQTKINLIIDGTYNDIRHTFKDCNTLNASDTITASNTLIQKVTVQNMDITGNNYYGIIYVPESASYKNIITEYNNITYNGPQISYHPTGLTRFINSNISINDTSLTNGGEVAECNKIEIGGNTTITHNSKGNSAFWFRNSNPSLTILENASVTFNSPNRELFYGPTNLEFTVAKNANFNVTTKNGLAYDTFGTGKTIIDENANFTINQTTYHGSYAVWYSYGSLTINENASLTIINEYPSITTSNYNIYFLTTSSEFNLNNPKKIILSNSAANTIYTNSTTKFNFKFSRINLFDTKINSLNSISKETLPTYSWYKLPELSEIKGTFTNSKTTITETNFTSEELSVLPALTNFNLINKKIISIGTLPQLINPITDQMIELTGVSSPNSSLLISFNDKSEIVLADENGNYSLNLESTLPKGTEISLTTKEANNPIYNSKNITIVYNGELTILSAPTTIEFELNAISKNPVICPKTKEITIEIADTRAISTEWNLYAIINNDPLSETGNTLESALIFKNGPRITPLSTTKTLVYTAPAKTEASKITTITWPKDETILLQILSSIKAGQKYTCTLSWIAE